jgi:urease accessory protein
MGASPTRITTEDFVTPSELAAWHLAATAAGRVGGVRLELVAHRCRTHLGYCYQQVPLRILPPFHFSAEDPALVYVLNPTAGLLDGDAQQIDLTARSGTRAVLTGQSATRIHPCLQGFSTQQWHIRVESGAVLVVLPGPAIPFEGCRYYQRVRIDLVEDAGLVWGDIWLAGRYARGPASERFLFDRLIQDLSVRRAGCLIYRDRFCWCGPWEEDTAAWHFGKFPACGSLFTTGFLAEAKCQGGSLFPTAAGDTCVRWCGPVEEVIAAVVRTALASGANLAGHPGMPWLLTSHGLAPNHWFTC